MRKNKRFPGKLSTLSTKKDVNSDDNILEIKRTFVLAIDYEKMTDLSEKKRKLIDF